MRHRYHGKKLNRSGSHRKALRMNLASQLLTHGRIRTTFHKAKFVQGHAERLITIAKRGWPGRKKKMIRWLPSTLAAKLLVA